MSLGAAGNSQKRHFMRFIAFSHKRIFSSHPPYLILLKRSQVDPLSRIRLILHSRVGLNVKSYAPLKSLPWRD